MYGSYDKNETNYWPCVSDMFLVFFILALALLSVHQRNSKMDLQKALAEQQTTQAHTNSITFRTVIVESNRLFRLQAGLVNKTAPSYSINDEEPSYRDQSTSTKPELASRLKQVHAWLADEQPTESEQEPIEDEQDYGQQICAIAQAVGVAPNYIASKRYDLILQEVNTILEKRYPSAKQAYAGLDVDELKNIIHAKNHKIEALNKEIARLNNQNKDLSAQLQKAQSALNDANKQLTIYKETNGNSAELGQKVADLRQENHKLSQENQRLTSISKEQETRIKQLNKNTRLVDEVLDEKIIYFKPNETKLLFTDKEAYTKDVIQDKILAQLNDTQYKDARLVIEIIGHTDDTGDDSINVELGLKRAISLKNDILQQLKQKAQASDINRISFKCFSAGSSQRLIRNAGESTDAWRKRCRRVEVLMRKDD